MDWHQDDIKARIACANGVQLTILTYEIAIHYTQEAIHNHQTDLPQFQRDIQSAQGAFNSLIDTLDMNFPISHTLRPIYVFLNQQLITAYFTKTSKPLTNVVAIASTLLDGWVSICDPEVDSPPQQIFAGLTYKNGQLAEYVKEDEHRGFKA